MVSVADAALCNNLFKKVLKALLVETTKEGADHSSSHSLSDIVLCMCSNLDDENLAWLFRTIAPQLKEDDPTMQKKAYKIVALSSEKHQAFFEAQWKNIMASVCDATVACKPAALKHRLRCLKAVLNNIPNFLEQSEVAQNLPVLLGEAILAVKEVNRKTRDVAYDVITSLARRILTENENSNLMHEYAIMLMGGLAGKTPRMKSASVLSLSRLIYEFKEAIEIGTLSEIFVTVLMLLREKAREVIKSVLGFIKVCIICMPPNAMQPHLEELVEGLTIWCAESKNRFRQKIRVIFEMLIKRFDPEHIKSLVPGSHVKLVEHIKKTMEREAKKKAEVWANKVKDKKAAQDDFEALMKDNEDDMDDTDDEDEEVQAPTNQGSKSKAAIKAARKAKKAAKDAALSQSEKKSKMWIRDTEVDLLDGNLNDHVVTADPKAVNVVQSKKKAQDRRITEGSDGKIVINPDASRGKWAGGDDDDEDMGDAPDSGSNPGIRPGKRKAARDDQGPAKRRKDQFGARFKAKKAGGDVKGKGGMQPFAFMSLDPSQLNKRHRDKAAGRFESVVSAARKGSIKGARQASKQTRAHLKAKRKHQQ